MEPFIYVNLFLLLTLVSWSTVSSESLVNDVHIECNSNDIVVTLSAGHSFNGMIYPKGLSKNSSCMSEYWSTASNITYKLPLRSCNTMSTDVDDGVEYFNTVVVQPHRRLVTNQGRGYHIRCRYQTREKRISNGFNVSMIGTTPVMATAPMPSCSMKIFVSDTNNEIVAENVKIGDKLTLAISIDYQDIYGMKVTNCLVRDGLNWGEQPLINDDGCPVDEEIMGPFAYTQNLTRSVVEFHAHKFPYTSSVYYQCNVRLCLKEAGGCEDVPPDCDKNGRNFRRRERRDTSDLIEDGSLADVRRDDVRDLSIEVYSGLYVNDNEDEDNECKL